MRFASLGSGSRGNASLIEAGSTRVLVDCGFSLRETESRLARLGVEPTEIDAVLVTHEHSDHIRGVGVLARKYATPVWASHGTLQHEGLGELPVRQEVNVHACWELQDLYIEPFPVPHDAREPCQFVFGDGRVRLGLLTDTGSLTSHLIGQLDQCDALMLECNHDEEMLRSGPYPPMLKRRVGGDYGHLSNAQAGMLLQQLDISALQHIVAMHLSEKNNCPSLAVQALSEVLDCTPDWITVADQAAGFDWRSV